MEANRRFQAKNQMSGQLTLQAHSSAYGSHVYIFYFSFFQELPDTSSLPLPILQDYFQDKHFFLYGNMAEEKRNLLYRYITAFNG